MICPNCNFENKYTTAYCACCGCALSDTSEQEIDLTPPYIPTPDFKKWQCIQEISLKEKVGFLDSPSLSLLDHRCNDITFSPDYMTLVLATASTSRKISKGATTEYNRIVSDYAQPVICPIRICDPITGESLRMVGNHTKPVNCIRFSRDGKFLASASDDKTIGIFDVMKDYQERSLKGHIGEVNSIAFSPDGKVLVSGSNDCVVRLWDVENGTGIKSIAGYSSFVRSVDFSMDGKIFASSSDNIIRIWDSKTHQCLCTLKEHLYGIHTIRFSPNNRYLLSCDSSEYLQIATDMMIILWNPWTGKPVRKEYIRCQSYCLEFFPDASHFALGMADGTIRIYETDTFRQTSVLGTPRLYSSTSSQAYEYATISLSFSPDGSSIAAGYFDNKVRIMKGEDEYQI